MKKIFSKSSQPPVTPYQEEQVYQRPAHKPSTSVQYPTFEERNGPISPLSRSNATMPQRRPSRGEHSSPMRSSRRPKSGGAYPTYGESYQDPAEARGAFAVTLSPNRGPALPLSDQVSHQKLPPRTMPNRSPADDTHSRNRSSNYTQSNWEAAQQEGRKERDYNSGGTVLTEPLSNPYSNGGVGHEAGAWRRNSVSRGQGGTMNRMRSVNRRASQSQSTTYGDESVKKPSRRPSLLYGVDSGLHGGQAAVAAANADEHEAELYSSERGGDVVRPESRYVDRIAEIKTPQSVAIGAGMDKMKRKLFGRKKKDERTEDQEMEKESSGEWARVDRPGSMDRPITSQKAVVAPNVEVDDRRAGEHNAVHAPWFSGMKNHKATEGIISSQIGNLCIQDEESWDWNQISALCNMVSHSELASKEAARALRKEFKYGDEEPKFQAIRLWGIVCIRASDRFRLQVAQKRFLEALEDLYTDKKGSTKIRGRLLVVWSMLANDYQLDQELFPICRMFNKIKPNDMPLNGIPLDLSHDLFNPPSIPEQQHKSNFAPSSQDIYHDYHSEQEPIQEKQEILQRQGQPYETHTTVIRTTSVKHSAPGKTIPVVSQDESLQEMPRISDDIRRLHEECQVARSNAQLLTESLIELGLKSDIVMEFAGKTQLSQDFILTQIPWASAQVDRSRIEREERIANGQGDIDRGKSTEEEILMEDLLGTHEKLIAANGMVEEARIRQREEEEERLAIERSMRDQRIDRSQMMQDSSTGQLYSIEGGLAPPSDSGQGSSSRSPSPAAPVGRKPLPVPGLDSTPMVKSKSTPSQFLSPQDSLASAPAPPSLNSSWTEHTAAARPITGSTTYRGGPRPMNGSDVSQGHSIHVQQTMGTEEDSDDNKDEVDDGTILTPIAPSAKALGKRRAMSIYEDVSPSQTSVNVPDLTNRVDALQMNPEVEVEALRARPPPALPMSSQPTMATTAITNEQRQQNNPFYNQSHPDPYDQYKSSNNNNNNIIIDGKPITNPFLTMRQ